MPRMVFFSLILTLVSCIESTQTQQITQREIFPLKSFTKLINQKSIYSKEEVNPNIDFSLINQDYPVEIWLYENNQYYYDLPNLGDGIGTWEYKNGYIALNNNHHIKTIDLKIEMNYDIYLTKENEIRIEFSDRFGTQNLDLDLRN